MVNHKYFSGHRTFSLNKYYDPQRKLETSSQQNSNQDKLDDQQKPIIIINHSPSNFYDPAYNYEHSQNGQMSNDELYYNNFIGDHKFNSEDVDSISIKDINPLISILNDITTVFDSYYKAIPEEAVQGNVSKNQMSSVLKFYTKIGTFVKEVIKERDSLKNKIDYLKAKIGHIKTSEEEVIDFFELTNNYMGMKKKIEEYVDLDENFGIYNRRIKETLESFSEDVKEIQDASSNLTKLNDFFTIELSALDEISDSRSTIDILEKFDQVLSLTLKLVEIRHDIEHSIKTLKEVFNRIQENKLYLEETIIESEKLAEEYDIKNRLIGGSSKKYSEKISHIFIFSLIMLVSI